MTDLPILFPPPMIRALLSGTKTQTRRKAWKDADYDTGRLGWAPSRARRRGLSRRRPAGRRKG